MRTRRAGIEGRGALCRQLELDPECDQALLGAVVQVVLDPPPLLLGRAAGAQARLAHLAQEPVGLRREALALERHQRVGRRGRGERRVLAERRIVEDRGDTLAAVEDLRQRLLGRRLRHRDLLAGDIDPVVARPVHELERRVVELLGQRASQLRRPEAPLQAHGEPLHRLGDEQPPAPDADEEGHSQQRDREAEQPRRHLRDGRLRCEPTGHQRGEEHDETEDRDREHRPERALGERARAADAQADANGHAHEERDREQLAQRAHQILDHRGLVRDDHERVRRAALAAGRHGSGHRVLLHQQRRRQVEAQATSADQAAPGRDPPEPGACRSETTGSGTPTRLRRPSGDAAGAVHPRRQATPKASRGTQLKPVRIKSWPNRDEAPWSCVEPDAIGTPTSPPVRPPATRWTSC